MTLFELNTDHIKVLRSLGNTTCGIILQKDRVIASGDGSVEIILQTGIPQTGIDDVFFYDYDPKVLKSAKTLKYCDGELNGHKGKLISPSPEQKDEVVSSIQLPYHLVCRLIQISKYAATPDRVSAPFHFTRLELENGMLTMFASNRYIAAMEQYRIDVDNIRFAINLAPEAIKFLKALPKMTIVTLNILRSNRVQLSAMVQGTQVRYVSLPSNFVYSSWRAIIPDKTVATIVLPVQVRRFINIAKKRKYSTVEINREFVYCFCREQEQGGERLPILIADAPDDYRLFFNLEFLLALWELDEPLTIKMSGQYSPALIYYQSVFHSCTTQWRLIMPSP